MARITVEDCLEQIPNRFSLFWPHLPRPHAEPGPCPPIEKEQARRDRPARNRRKVKIGLEMLKKVPG